MNDDFLKKRTNCAFQISKTRNPQTIPTVQQRTEVRNVPAWQTPTYHLKTHKLVRNVREMETLGGGGNFVNRGRDHSENPSAVPCTATACCAVRGHSFGFILTTSSLKLNVAPNITVF